MKQIFFFARRKTPSFLFVIMITIQTTTILSAQELLFTEINPRTLILNPTQQTIVNYFSGLSYNAGLVFVQVGNLATIQQNGIIHFTIPEFETAPLAFKEFDVKYKSPNDYTWLGQMDLTQGEMTFYAKPEGYGGTIDLGTRYYSINPLGGNLALIMKHNITAYPPGGCVSNSNMETSSTNFCKSEDCGNSVVDILVVVTPAANAQMTAQWGTLAGFYLWEGTNSMNEALAFSGIPNKSIRVQFMNAVPGFALTNNPFTDIATLTADPIFLGFFDAFRADIIVLITNQNYLDPTSGNRIFGIANSTDPTSENKFCIVESGFLLDPRYSFAHEVAHQFGCHHIETDDSHGDPCAHGHFLTLPGNITRATILGPSPAINFGAVNARIQHYSNPDIFFAGISTGISDQRDNAREIRSAMCEAANNEPPAGINISINGATSFCSINGNLINPVYTVDITPPVAGLPGQPPYNIQWYWSQDGFPGTYIGTGNSITANLFACPSFYLFAVVTSGDGQTYTEKKKIYTALCSACPQNKMTDSQQILPKQTTDDSENVKIFPNPTDGIFMIDFIDNFIPLKIELFDLNGSKVLEVIPNPQSDDQHHFKIDLKGQPCGFYMLKLQNKDKIISRKLVVQTIK
jgi:hypothetical protein